MGSGSAFPFKQRGYNPPLQEVSEASRSSPGEAPKSVTSGVGLAPEYSATGAAPGGESAFLAPHTSAWRNLSKRFPLDT